jgi:hypothetical protein
VLTKRKPFDVLAKGSINDFSRDNKTAIELFRRSPDRWDVVLRRRVDGPETRRTIEYWGSDGNVWQLFNDHKPIGYSKGTAADAVSKLLKLCS